MDIYAHKRINEWYKHLDSIKKGLEFYGISMGVGDVFFFLETFYQPELETCLEYFNQHHIQI